MRETAGSPAACVLVTVKNVGSKMASSFSVDLFLDPSKTPVPGDRSSRTTTISALGGGAYTTILFSGVPFPEHWVDLVVDSGKTVSEYRESNNVRALTDT